MNSLAVHLVKQHEAFRRFVYDDATGKPLKPGNTIEGHPTIGYGLCLDTRGIPQEDAELLTTRYIVELERSLRVERPVFGTLSMIRQAVIIDMAYNLGVGGVLGFKRMWDAIERANYREAAEEMLDSAWALQVGERADRLAGMMEYDRL